MSAEDKGISRRDFVKTGAAASAGAAVLMASGSYAFAQGSDTIKVGLVGCGGRGKGAAYNAASAAEGVEIVALGDLFKFQVDSAKNDLKGLGAKYKVTDDHCYSGWDAYQKVIDTPDVNYVILATPPGFRPMHFEAAVKAGKNIFFEKPVATDANGIRTVLLAADAAKEKKLGVVAGTQRRHQLSYLETMKRLQDGAIGEILGGQFYWNGGGIWFRDRDPKMSDLEYQAWNWYHYIWACGDQICEQHVHNLDVMCWVMGGHPLSAYASGGRTQRTDPRTQIWDHILTDFEYPNGVHTFSSGRHWGNCTDRVDEHVIGSKGHAAPGGWIAGPNKWNFPGGGKDPYTQEHTDLIESIRSGKPLNEGRQVAVSTMTAIMARQSAYSGKLVKWDEALNSTVTFMPDLRNPSAACPMGPIPMPGKTQI